METRYRVGIDVGLYSIGFAAVEVDATGRPIRLLNSMVQQHDAGVDPLQGKTQKTRLAESGVARRTRRLMKRRRKRLKALDRFILEQGWPLVDLEQHPDPWLPWQTRHLLVTSRISTPQELGAALSIALRHMARHRGWRNPWTSVSSLRATTEPSEYLDGFRNRVAESLGRDLPKELTPAELVMLAKTGPQLKIRGEGSVIGGKLHQSDNVRELRAIAAKQGLSDDLFVKLTERVFQAQSPRGAAAKLAGKDSLPSRQHLPRAAKATIAFQRFRMAGVIANIRVVDESRTQRPLSVDERRQVMSFLDKSSDEVTWADVAEHLGIKRRQLKGTAGEGLDGDYISTRPPINLTNSHIESSKIAPIKKWWKTASLDEHEALVQLLSNGGDLDESSPAAIRANELIESLSEAESAKLDSLHLSAGRAAYSEKSLRELTERMLTTEEDLHHARKTLFGVDDNWAPPVEPIGEPVGNPAVDRVLKSVARWLQAAEREWGTPESIQVEHVRNAFASAATAQSELRRKIFDDERRYKQRKVHVAEMQASFGVSGDVSTADVRRYQAVQRQNSQCLYCGSMITFATAEMDHIVPRAGTGSTNTRENLVAVCRPCNADKADVPFKVWAAKTKRPKVSVDEALARVDHFLEEDGLRGKARRDYINGLKRRLKADELDDPIDARSIESVAWMANQLHLRVKAHFTDSDVAVFRGNITAWARLASGIERRIEFIGGSGKTRLDRRHHAIDAAVTAMLRPAVATTLTERQNLRSSQYITGDTSKSWREYRGQEGNLVLYDRWLTHMEELVDLLNQALREDRIPIVENMRLRLGSSSAHDDTINSLDYYQVGDTIPANIIDRASTPALWCALTRLPDYDPKEGLPADPERKIRVLSKHLTAANRISFFKTGAAAIAVRGGYAEIGNTIHHARIYRVTAGKKTFYAMLRVFATDLLRHRKEDLFSVELPPQSISVRTAETKLRVALADGSAEYLGWLVEGDELLLDMTAQTSGQVGELLETYPETRRWRVAGFPTDAKIRLRPQFLAAEGLSDSTPLGVSGIVAGMGWRPAVNVLLSKCKPVIIRRNSLGRVRLHSSANLPVTWSIKDM